MSVVNAGLMLSAPSGYTIDRSLRFRASASAYLNWTPSSAGDRRTWTFSLWAKLGYNSSNQRVFGCHLSANDLFGCYITTGGQLVVWSNISGVASLRWNSNALLRDYSAWYHLVFVLDTTQATSTDRFKVYLNNEQLTTSSYTAPAQNSQQHWNNTNAMWIGKSQYAGNFDGYLTEVNFIDGQALDASSFGEYNEDTGVWQPKKYVGTYGTNGFYLNFSDNSSTTTLGEDGSGNGNDWTLNNFSLTSGSTYDSMTDVPTLTSETQGNYATLNPLDYVTSRPTNGNLKLTNGFSRATMAIPSTGKWYWENLIGSSSNNSCGLSPASSSVSAANGGTGFYAYYIGGDKYTAGSASAYGASYTNGDVIGVAVDADAGTVTFYKNNVSQGVAFTGLDFSSPWLPLARPITSATTDINFGQRPFAYTPPTGFKALNTYNLPDSTVADGSKHFDVVTYTGNSTDNTAIGGLEFEPSLVWLKSRSNVYHHSLFDQIRGGSNALYSSLNYAETTESGVKTFEPDGFTLGTSAGSNYSGFTYVAWNWKANGSGVSNTDGSTTSTVSANTTAGFSIVTFTSLTGTNSVGHGLGVKPKIVIQKRRDSTSSWYVYYDFVDGSLDYLTLNTASGAAAWSGTAATSSVFYENWGAGADIVAYCFAEVEGYSKMGSYTGNGSTDGPFVYTGFRPAWVMIKIAVGGTANWLVQDSTRDAYNPAIYLLTPNTSNAEASASAYAVDFAANGFKLRNSTVAWNYSGATFIYLAFAETPAKYALAR